MGNVRGFSLVEVMISAAILAVVGAGSLGLYASQAKTQKSVQLAASFQQTLGALQMFLGSPNSCAEALKGAVYRNGDASPGSNRFRVYVPRTDPPSLYLRGDEGTLGAGTQFPNGLHFSELRLAPLNPDDAGEELGGDIRRFFADLLIEAERPDRANVGGRSLSSERQSFKVALDVDTTTSTVVGCSSGFDPKGANGLYVAKRGDTMTGALRTPALAVGDLATQFDIVPTVTAALHVVGHATTAVVHSTKGNATLYVRSEDERAIRSINFGGPGRQVNDSCKAPLGCPTVSGQLGYVSEKASNPDHLDPDKNYIYFRVGAHGGDSNQAQVLRISAGGLVGIGTTTHRVPPVDNDFSDGLFLHENTPRARLEIRGHIPDGKDRTLLLTADPSVPESGSAGITFAKAGEPDPILFAGLGFGLTAGQWARDAQPTDLVLRSRTNRDLLMARNFTSSDSCQSFDPNGSQTCVLSAIRVKPETGYVGVGGQASPAFPLDVRGDVRASGSMIASAFLQSSDRRLKEDLRPLEGALEKIKELRGYSYRFRDKEKLGDARQLGVVAQEVEKVFPEAVGKAPDGSSTVSYASLIAPLIESVRELEKRVQKQEERLRKIEGRCGL